MEQKIIIDADPGVDDTAAILLALASPEVSVQAITAVYGNGVVENCTRNALTILEAAQRSDIPVFKGASTPLTRKPHIAKFFHGENAFGNVSFPEPQNSAQQEHAAVALVEKVMANPHEIKVVALGPLTNVALALSLEPRLAENIQQLIIMGGAVFTYGNATPTASANLFNDPEAAAIVFRSGVNLVQVGLDVCRKVFFSQQDLDRISTAKTPTTDMLAKITPFHANAGRKTAADGEIPSNAVERYNDIPAIAYCVWPSFFKSKRFFVQISVHDELTLGQTVADVGRIYKKEPNADVLLEVNAEAVVKNTIDRITTYRTEI